jgi:hypothetical protein
VIIGKGTPAKFAEPYLYYFYRSAVRDKRPLFRAKVIYHNLLSTRSAKVIGFRPLPDGTHHCGTRPV